MGFYSFTVQVKRDVEPRLEDFKNTFLFLYSTIKTWGIRETSIVDMPFPFLYGTIAPLHAFTIFTSRLYFNCSLRNTSNSNS